MIRVVHIVGARPNFMKIAPVSRALEARPEVEQTLVHTGQHYDPELSDRFFEQLDIRPPDIELGVGSAPHGEQTGRIMIELEPVLGRLDPDWVVVVGDVNSTLAGALTAAKLGLRIAHVEAGLRSRDWSMPEEINRVLTDRLSHALFTTERSAAENLRAEGIDAARIHFVGNVMIDTLDRFRERAAGLDLPGELGLEPRSYVLATLHRPSNVDDPLRLRALLRALATFVEQSGLAVVLPLHPRTAASVEREGLSAALEGLRALEPLGYLEFLGLMDRAAAVVTDSGGIQEETTVLGIPCVTVRSSTERPITLTEGTNRLFTGAPDGLVPVLRGAVGEPRRPGRPERWDGRAAERIAAILCGDASAGR